MINYDTGINITTESGEWSFSSPRNYIVGNTAAAGESSRPPPPRMIYSGWGAVIDSGMLTWSEEGDGRDWSATGWNTELKRATTNHQYINWLPIHPILYCVLIDYNLLLLPDRLPLFGADNTAGDKKALGQLQLCSEQLPASQCTRSHFQRYGKCLASIMREGQRKILGECGGGEGGSVGQTIDTHTTRSFAM